MTEYQTATFPAADGKTYQLAEEVLAHLVELVLAEQREHERTTGVKATPARRRPAFKEQPTDG